MEDRKTNIIKGYGLPSLLATALLTLSSCASDLLDGSSNGKGKEVEFAASITDDAKVSTRALVKKYINSQDFDVNFFIESYDETTSTSEFETYVVPSGYEGRLSILNGEPLNWQDLHNPHDFYAWTLPWLPDWDPKEDMSDEIEVVFHNSSEAEGYAQNENNKILEKFIGAKTGPYSYADQGMYVDLTFYHLVSKIKIQSLSLIETDGSIVRDLKADITFVGMPTTATFYPHPSGEILDLPYCRDGRPVVKPGEINLDDGITYYVDNYNKDNQGTDIFYICPEVDFSQIGFKVELNDVKYSDYATYYGTFENVVFSRTPDNDYDLGNGLDDHILHAGEMMSLDIVLIPGLGPGLSIIITKWNEDTYREAQYHSHPGIYTEADLKSILDVFVNQKDYDNPPEEIERLWEMYGEEIDGKKYFPLFDNVTLNRNEFPSNNIFPIPDGYVLDGQGHTIFMSTNRGYNGDFGSTQTYYNIGECRDVYLADLDGNNSIYIDSTGYVWLFNSDTGQYEKTDNFLPPLEAPYKSYDISAETGKVHRSTYYNNNIVGS